MRFVLISAIIVLSYGYPTAILLLSYGKVCLCIAKYLSMVCKKGVESLRKFCAKVLQKNDISKLLSSEMSLKILLVDLFDLLAGEGEGVVAAEDINLAIIVNLMGNWRKVIGYFINTLCRFWYLYVKR